MAKSYQHQYAEILRRLIHNPDKMTPSRIGNVRSRFVETIRVDLEKEFPLMEIKDVSFKNILVELLWFIGGNTNIKQLVDNNCNIWNDDAYRFYKERYSPHRFKKEDKSGQLKMEIDDEIDKETFIKRVKEGKTFLDVYISEDGTFSDELAWLDTTYTYGDLGRIYGQQWRNFNNSSDQLLTAIETLKVNPDDRRMIVTAHNPTDIETGNVGLPSCHNYFQFYTTPLTASERAKLDDSYHKEITFETDADIHKYCDEKGLPSRKLSIYYNIRSNDFFLGQPYNTPSYSLLLLMVSRVVNMTPGEVVCNAVDCHLYEAHLDAAKEWLNRYDDRFNGGNESDTDSKEAFFTYCHSNVVIKRQVKSIDDYKIEDFELKNYNSDGRIKASLLT